MTAIYSRLLEFFEEDGWDFQETEGMTILSMGFAGTHGEWLCYAQAREKEEQFLFYSVLPINVPESRLAQMAEFLMRVNYGMVIGNFEMDYEDGEIRYKSSVDVEGTELNAALIRQMVYANLLITDRYLPGVMRVVYNDESPLDILESLELPETMDEFTLDNEDEPPFDELPPKHSPN